MKAKLAVFASGDGTNFEAIVKAAREGQLAADVVGLITNRHNIGVLQRAQRLGVPASVIVPRDFATRPEWNVAVLSQLHAWGTEWVALAGFLALIGRELLQAFPARVINSHPSLLPRHGGPGMYGSRVHAAVVAAGERESGVTIHTIDEEYDRGHIVAQVKVPVLPGDTGASLEDRVKAVEIALFPKVLNDLVTGRIRSDKSI